MKENLPTALPTCDQRIAVTTRAFYPSHSGTRKLLASEQQFRSRSRTAGKPVGKFCLKLKLDVPFTGTPIWSALLVGDSCRCAVEFRDAHRERLVIRLGTILKDTQSNLFA